MQRRLVYVSIWSLAAFLACEQAGLAKEPPAKTPAVQKTSAATPSAASDPTLDVAVKWMPKPPTNNPAAEAKNQKGMKPYTEKIPGTDVSFQMAPIPAGSYTMGSPTGEKGRKNDEGPQVKVKIEPFWMEKHEVTWNEYELWGLGLDKQRRDMKKTTASSWDKLADAVAIPTKPYSDMTFGMGKDGFPAICMTQFAAKMYCKWLTAKTGHYYRLPTEAEWEYACRAGSKTAYSFGDDPKKLDDYAWYSDNSDEKYHKVGLKKPNRWGLYDMHGNVAEWCLDEYVADRYKQLAGKAGTNPFTTTTKSYPQVVRGGAWTDEAPRCAAPPAADRARSGNSRTRKFRRASGIIPTPISSASGWSARCGFPPPKRRRATRLRSSRSRIFSTTRRPKRESSSRD